jgi:hypothetical protein
MKCVSDNDKLFGFHYPSQTVWVQVFKRGDPPSLVTSGIEVRYIAPENRKNPSATLDFWKYAPVIHNKELPVNVGKAGLAAAGGVFTLNAEAAAYVAKSIPVSPYDDGGVPDPYPLYTVQAVDSSSGKVLAETKVNTPVSSANNCHQCHGGTPPVDGYGFGDETAKNFLSAHDKYNNTTLLADALKGQPKLCQSCHSAPNIGAKGKPEVLSLSAAMHGWHAQYIKGGTVDRCGLCHPSTPGPESSTVCLRDVHAGFDVSCGQCHGEMSLHAGSVLMAQADLPDAARAIDRIKAAWGRIVPEPRTPWFQEPDCLSCHPNHTKASADSSAYNKWVSGPEKLFRNDKANGGVMCSSCHGSPHLIYPNSTFGGRVTNYQPESYMGVAAPQSFGGSCGVCHITPISGDFIHANIGQPFYPPAKSKP